MDRERAQMLIGSRYVNTLNEIIASYRTGNYHLKNALLKDINGLKNPVSCYLCKKRIEEEHIMFDIGGRITAHNMCVEMFDNRIKRFEHK